MKVTVIKFPPEHEDRLRRLCIKKQFLRNLARQGQDPQAYADWAASNKVPWLVFIDEAFHFDESPEGRDFWSEIAHYKTRK